MVHCFLHNHSLESVDDSIQCGKPEVCSPRGPPTVLPCAANQIRTLSWAPRCLNKALSSLLSAPMALDKSQLEKALNAGSVNKSSQEPTSQNLTLTLFLLRVLNHTFVPVLKSLFSDSCCPKYQSVSACRAFRVICAEQWLGVLGSSSSCSEQILF